MSDQTPFHVFYSIVPSMQVIDSKGQPIIFVSGRFHTRDEGKIAFLNQMIADGTTAIFTKPDQLTMSADDLDPMKALKAKHIKEYLEEQARQLDPNANVSESVQERLNPASTSDIAPVAAGGGASTLATVRAQLNAAKLATPAA